MTQNTVELQVSGMTCDHCQRGVASALRGVPGVREVQVNLQAGRATVWGDADAQELARAVQGEGYGAEVVTAPTHTSAHGHLCMPEGSRKQALRRLAIARGHLESIQRQLENPQVYCIDVLKQLSAVQGALSGAGQVVLRGHLEAHVATAALRGDEGEIVAELMEALKYT